MSEQTVIFPWPPAILSPNGRPHHMALYRAKKLYKQACWALAKEAHMTAPADSRPLVTMTFVPPTRRNRDADNLVAMMKAGLDGLAEAMGCNDSRFRLGMPVVLTDQIGGFVRVVVSE